MKIEAMEALMYMGREIEFDYNGNRYSIAYEEDEKGKTVIDFCKFTSGPVVFTNPYDIFDYQIGGKPLRKIFAELPDSAFDIF